jgi:16S rRNA (adenine1518-N6/adenine1519-N6)-dimethyltransferase
MDSSVGVSPQDGGVRLLTPRDVRSLTERYGVRPVKSLGQNFVVDPGTVRRIVRLAHDLPLDDDACSPSVPRDGFSLGGRHVVEVGPGLGSLTLGLLAEGWRVTAIEVDRVLAQALPGIVAERAGGRATGLTVIHADALAVGDIPGPGPAPSALIANLPYNVSVPVILHAMARFAGLRGALVMVQAEVADRLVAGPGGRAYGVPSAKLAWYATARRVGGVGRAAFWPVPRVDSALVAMVRHDAPPTPASREAVFAVIDAAFSQRRKMLRSALAAWAGSAERAGAVLAAAGIDARARGERLTVAQFARIAEADAEVGR